MGKEMIGTVFITSLAFGAETKLQIGRILLRPPTDSTPVSRSGGILLRCIAVYHPPLSLFHRRPKTLRISGDQIKDNKIHQRRYDQKHTHNTLEMTPLDTFHDLYGIKSKIEVPQPLCLFISGDAVLL